MGYGAVNELLRILEAFTKELPEPYLTFNTGLVLGGTSATLKHLARTEASISFRELMPPMSPERNRGLLHTLNAINEDLGLSTVEELDPMQRGGGDISFVAKDLECLTGMGSIGSGAHAPGETVDLTSLALQAKRAAIMMYRLSR